MPIKVSRTQSKNQSNTYPLIMEGPLVTVLFDKRGSGTVLASKHSAYPIGYYSNNLDMDPFIPYNGSITLENI